MAKTFTEGLHELSEKVGHGDLTGHVIVDQVYAHYQHERLDLHHPRGGGPKYLERPLVDNREKYFEGIAHSMLNEGPHRGMIDAVEDLSDQVVLHAPVEWWDLRRSGHPFVDDDGTVVYDRPPFVHRLTEDELKAKGRFKPMPGALLGYIWWHVMKKQHPPNWKGGA